MLGGWSKASFITARRPAVDALCYCRCRGKDYPLVSVPRFGVARFGIPRFSVWGFGVVRRRALPGERDLSRRLHSVDELAGRRQRRPGVCRSALQHRLRLRRLPRQARAPAYLDWSRRWIAAVHRVLKASGTFWLAIGDEYAAELKLASQEVGFHSRSWVVWYYTFGVNCKQKFSRSHAHLFYFVKDPAAVHVPAPRNWRTAFPRLGNWCTPTRGPIPRGRLPDDTWVLRPQDLADCFTTSEDTWYFPRVAGTFKERAGFHGCQMPEQLLGRIVRFCSQAEELVLDPFSGSRRPRPWPRNWAAAIWRSTFPRITSAAAASGSRRRSGRSAGRRRRAHAQRRRPPSNRPSRRATGQAAGDCWSQSGPNAVARLNRPAGSLFRGFGAC